MTELRYLAPATLDEAIKAFASAGSAGRILAGGTDLLVQMRSGAVKPGVIVDIKKIAEMTAIEQTADGGFRIGAAVPGAVLSEHPHFGKAWPGLLEAIIDRTADVLERVGVDIDAVSKDIFRVKSDQAQNDYQKILMRLGRHNDLASKAREHLFTAFQGGARKGGSGLGLAISAELVRGHGGRLDLVRSDADGTEFLIRLPKSVSPA